MTEDETTSVELMCVNSSEKCSESPKRYSDYAECDDIPRDSKDEILLSQHHENQLKGPFPFKLHTVLKILDQEGSHGILSWNHHGRSFLIKNQQKFETEVIPRFFKTNQMSSFRRQLNLYEFVRINDGPESGCYYHELFLRSKPLLSLKMERVNRKGTITRPRQDSPPFTSFPSLPPLKHRVPLSMTNVPPKVTIGMTIRGAIPSSSSVDNRNQFHMDPNLMFNSNMNMGGVTMVYRGQNPRNNIPVHNSSMGPPYINMDQQFRINLMNGRGTYNPSDFGERSYQSNVDLASNMNQNGCMVGSFSNRTTNMTMDQDETLDRYSMISGRMSDRNYMMGNRMNMEGEIMNNMPITYGSTNVLMSNAKDPMINMNTYFGSSGSMMSHATTVMNMKNHINNNFLHSNNDGISNRFKQQQLFLHQNQPEHQSNTSNRIENSLIQPREYVNRIRAPNVTDFSDMISQNGIHPQNFMSMNNFNNAISNGINKGSNTDDYSMMERLSAHLRRRGRDSLPEFMSDEVYEERSIQSSQKRKTHDVETESSRKSVKSDGIQELTKAAFRMASVSLHSDIGSSEWTHNSISDDANLTRTFMSVQSERDSENALSCPNTSHLSYTNGVGQKNTNQATRYNDTYYHENYGT